MLLWFGMNSREVYLPTKDQTKPYPSTILANTSFSIKGHPFMASSSKPQKDLDDPLKQEKEEEKEGDWLELGLGLGSFCGKPVNRSSLASVSASSSSLSFPLQQTLHQSGLKLGLGIDNESPARCESLSALPGNYDLYHHDNNTRPSFAFLTSPTSLSSWPWHVDSNSFLAHQNNRLIPVPAETHCYYGRSQSGLWFTLRSSTNRNREELPQIPKAYIRVKDENVTVFMVKTYLVRKLGLSNEAEVDISCMGQKLPQSHTLKHVRDAIWLPGLVESVNSQDILVNHLMSLQYGRR